jgi:hypothetical protein
MSFINTLYLKIKEKIEDFFNDFEVSDYKYSSETLLHPLYIQIKENASLYLLKNGYSIYKEERGEIIYKNNIGVYIFITNQGYEFPDVFIGKEDNRDKLTWFVTLEKKLTGEVELSIKHGELGNFYDFEYEKEFLETFSDLIENWSLNNN